MSGLFARMETRHSPAVVVGPKSLPYVSPQRSRKSSTNTNPIIGVANVERPLTLATHSEGMSSVVFRDDLIVYGGEIHNKVWCLQLKGARWIECVTVGAVPGPRLYHSACTYKNHMLIFGGELLLPSATEGQGYFEMDLSTMCWMNVQCHGVVPALRSHHTATVYQDKMYVLGGKSVTSHMTVRTMLDDQQTGFYDLHVLDIVSKSWSRVERNETVAPILWAHTTVLSKDFLVIFGGFDSTDLLQGIAQGPLDRPPNATLSDIVFFFHIPTFKWSMYTPQSDMAWPAPRAFHNAHVYGTLIIMFGGMSLDDQSNAVYMNDVWVLAVETGKWRRIDFCVARWDCKRLISGVYCSQLVVLDQLNHVHTLDLRNMNDGWRTIGSNPGKVSIVSSDEVVKQPMYTLQDVATSPLKNESPRRHQEVGVITSPITHLPEDIQMTQSEIDALKLQVLDLQNQVAVLLGHQKSRDVQPTNNIKSHPSLKGSPLASPPGNGGVERACSPLEQLFEIANQRGLMYPANPALLSTQSVTNTNSTGVLNSPASAYWARIDHAAQKQMAARTAAAMSGGHR